MKVPSLRKPLKVPGVPKVPWRLTRPNFYTAMNADQEAEIAAEQAFATSAPVEGGLIYGNYAARALNVLDDLERAIAACERDIDAAREELRLAYVDLKKYEILQRQRDEEAAREVARIEQAELDEIGIDRRRREMIASRTADTADGETVPLSIVDDSRDA